MLAELLLIMWKLPKIDEKLKFSKSSHLNTKFIVESKFVGLKL